MGSGLSEDIEIATAIRAHTAPHMPVYLVYERRVPNKWQVVRSRCFVRGAGALAAGVTLPLACSVHLVSRAIRYSVKTGRAGCRARGCRSIER